MTYILLPLVVDCKNFKTFSGELSPYGSSERSSALPGSSNTFSTTPSLMIAAYLQDLSPKHLSLLEHNIPTFSVNSPLPSGMTFTFSNFCLSAHAFITKESFTDIQ